MTVAILVAVMAIVTILIRFLPFMIFRKRIPEYIVYLGKVLPAAIMGMLIVYCLKDVDIRVYPHGTAELIAAAVVIGVHVWKRNAIASILTGTIIYMVLVQMVF